MSFYINTKYLLKEIEYPRRYQQQNLFKNSFILFLIILMFLLLFKPFGVYDPELKMHYFFICFFHALSPALILFFYFGALNYFRKSKTQNKWTLLTEFYQIGILFFLIGSTSFLMRDLIYHNPDNWSRRYFFEEMRNCFVAGIFFYLFLRLSNFYFESKKGSQFFIQFIPLPVTPEITNSKSDIFITTQVKQDDFCLTTDQLLFAKADGNYIELTQFIDNQITTEIKRMTLTQFESQIVDYPYFFRCHRTYLVNMYKIKRVSGNSQGYLLSFHETNIKIPVSRKQTDSFKNCYEQLQIDNSARLAAHHKS